jgi:hypothetical protein
VDLEPERQRLLFLQLEAWRGPKRLQSWQELLRGPAAVPSEPEPERTVLVASHVHFYKIYMDL